MPKPEMKAAGKRCNANPANENQQSKRSFEMNMPVVSEDFNNIQITEHDGALRVSSRDVAQNFGKSHDKVLRSIRNLECSDKFSVANFGETPYVDPQNGQTYQMYYMTRDGFTFLVMGFTGKDAAAWKEKYIAAFNAMDQRLRQPVALAGPQLMAAALIEADATMKHQAKQIEAMQEDVTAHQRLVKAEGSLNITEAAKGLGMRPKELFNWLSQNGWIYKRPGGPSWLGYQSKCNAGLLEHKSTSVLRADGSEKISEQVRVTAKGLDKLARLVFPSARMIGVAS